MKRALARRNRGIWPCSGTAGVLRPSFNHYGRRYREFTPPVHSTRWIHDHLANVTGTPQYLLCHRVPPPQYVVPSIVPQPRRRHASRRPGKKHETKKEGPSCMKIRFNQEGKSRSQGPGGAQEASASSVRTNNIATVATRGLKHSRHHLQNPLNRDVQISTLHFFH